jgi:hypothetical protein
MLTLGCSDCETALCSCAGGSEDGALFASVAPPAIEVSGTPVLRGGGSGYSDEGR